ncbi:unnamed protein product [Mucor fragilis]
MAEIGDIIHYQKAESSSTICHKLLILFLQCFPYKSIVINLKKLETIFEACLKDAVKYLAAPIGATNSNLFQEDLPGSSCTDDTSRSDELELKEQERRITKYIDQQVKNLNANEDGVLTANDWESFIAG